MKEDEPVDSKQNATGIPDFSVGDTVRVNLKIVEGDRERIQAYEGIVISRRGSGMGETFTVRRISFGEGVERIFPLQSPKIHSIEVVNYGRVRRAKLYYLRERVGKSVRVKRGAGPKEAVVPETEQDESGTPTS